DTSRFFHRKVGVESKVILRETRRVFSTVKVGVESKVILRETRRVFSTVKVGVESKVILRETRRVFSTVKVGVESKVILRETRRVFSTVKVGEESKVILRETRRVFSTVKVGVESKVILRETRRVFSTVKVGVESKVILLESGHAPRAASIFHGWFPLPGISSLPRCFQKYSCIYVLYSEVRDILRFLSRTRRRREEGEEKKERRREEGEEKRRRRGEEKKERRREEGSWRKLFFLLGAVVGPQRAVIRREFFIVLLIILLVELILLILFFVYTDKVSDNAKDDLRDGLRLYDAHNNVGLRNAWNIIQAEWECCGVIGYTDWHDALQEKRVPDLCCQQHYKECGRNSSSSLWAQGCYERVEEWLDDNKHLLGTIVMGVLVIQLLGMAFSMTLYQQIHRVEKYDA
uniref:Tetraspanin n=1 Tax=Denticeps clupeoides TaxID=299321 RepID=A0AAY4C1T3_9TELE